MSLPFQRYARPVFRAHHPRWSFAPESGDGAQRRGGRFNRKGVAALYTSLLPQTAWLEAQQAFPLKAQPLTLVSYEVDCANILDLTDASVRKAADAPYTDLGCAWEDLVLRGETPPSWRVAERLVSSGAAGAIVPSFASGARTGDLNLVFWRWSRSAPHAVRAIDDEGRLPKDDRSWR